MQVFATEEGQERARAYVPSITRGVGGPGSDDSFSSSADFVDALDRDFEPLPLDGREDGTGGVDTVRCEAAIKDEKAENMPCVGDKEEHVLKIQDRTEADCIKTKIEMYGKTETYRKTLQDLGCPGLIIEDYHQDRADVDGIKTNTKEFGSTLQCNIIEDYLMEHAPKTQDRAKVDNIKTNIEEFGNTLRNNIIEDYHIIEDYLMEHASKTQDRAEVGNIKTNTEEFRDTLQSNIIEDYHIIEDYLTEHASKTQDRAAVDGIITNTEEFGNTLQFNIIEDYLMDCNLKTQDRAEVDGIKTNTEEFGNTQQFNIVEDYPMVLKAQERVESIEKSGKTLQDPGHVDLTEDNFQVLDECHYDILYPK